MLQFDAVGAAKTGGQILKREMFVFTALIVSKTPSAMSDHLGAIRALSFLPLTQALQSLALILRNTLPNQ